MGLVSIGKERWHVLALGLAVLLGSGLSTWASTAAASGDAEIPRPPPCEGELEVIGIVYVVEDPARSMAMVGTKGSNLVRVGSWIGERQVLDMGPRSLVLGPAEDACLMRLTDRSPVRRTRSSRRGRRRSRRR